MTLATGDHLGPYEIVSRVGVGGMGEVWRARDSRLDRSVAIKILPAEYAHDARVRLRFEREAKAISQLNHPHICTLHDFGSDRGIDYLVMELLDGESLADRIGRGPLPLGDVLRYGAQIAEALDRAHRAGIIHRDLKPANVMLTRSGVKLLDFGLAKASALEVGTDGVTQQKPLTAEGTIVGTFQYMAPEQLEGTDADARTDLWALGAVLYEMATGQRAFKGLSKTSLIAAIVSAEPQAITELQPLTPPALEHLIAKCLSKQPDDRWQSAHDVAEELRWIGEAGSRAGVAPTPRRTLRTTWILAGALLVAVGALGWLALRPRPRPDVLEVSIVPNGNSGLDYRSFPPALSPDGKLLVISARDAKGKRMLWLRSMASGTMQPLAGTENGYSPFWSPDGRFFGFGDGGSGQLKKYSVSGGEIGVLAEKTLGGWSWNRDGVILFGVDSPQAIRRIAATGGDTALVMSPSTVDAELIGWPRFLPDGNHFLFLALGDALARRHQAGLWLGTLDHSEPPHFLTAASSNAMYVEPGYLLYAREDVLYAQPFDARKLRLSSSNTLAIGPVQTREWSALFAATDSGLLLYQPPLPPPQTQLVLKDRKGETVRSVGAPGLHWAPRVS